MQEEIWKDIPGYEGLYQASNQGMVRSMDRVVNVSGHSPRPLKGRILKLHPMGGYLGCFLCANGVERTYRVHQLIAMAFLNHTPAGNSLVVDHINNIKTDNRLENLQIVTNRHNVSKSSKGTSDHTGVSWQSRDKRWKAAIGINGKSIYLGYFTDESEAALAYQKALENHLESLKNC